MATYVTGEEVKNAVSAAVLAPLTSANRAFVDAIQSLMTSTGYDFDTNNKNLAIALNIADVPAKGETMQGVEFSSAS